MHKYMKYNKIKKRNIKKRKKELFPLVPEKPNEKGTVC